MMINDLRIFGQLSLVRLAAAFLATIWVVLALLIPSQQLPKAKVRLD
ncbi:MAG: hypothetical protein AB8B62_08305 [Roseobacter sp.]